MTEPIDELLEWLHTFDDLQFSCNHRNVIEKIWQIKSKQQLLIPRVVLQSEQLCDNPHCEDGIVDRDMYGHPIYCQVCESHN